MNCTFCNKAIDRDAEPYVAIALMNGPQGNIVTLACAEHAPQAITLHFTGMVNSLEQIRAERERERELIHEEMERASKIKPRD